MAKVIMVQGTMSNAGKSLLVAGLCRIMRQDGYVAAPFKSQNMALNSFVTKEGLEMGRAQAVQAEAAGIRPMAAMNPILLKPTSHTGSQVIVNGKVLGNMSAKEYFSFKKSLIPDIRRAFQQLEEFADIIVIEGAGSPAEINLKENDIVNMGLAALVDAPVLLVGDIDRGGVFAQLLGTLMLLEPQERARVEGLIINKFRGDQSLLATGITMLKERGGVDVAGVVPYMDISIEDEDSLTERFDRKAEKSIDIAVIRYPRISNFTDFHVFEQMSFVSVRYVTAVSELHRPDLVILPGSKNTMGDLTWMRQNGLEDAVKKLAGTIPVWGICGGFQMLGCRISDPCHVEAGGEMQGMGLLSVTTELTEEKVRRQVSGRLNGIRGIFSTLSGLPYRGYEIHMGRTAVQDGAKADEPGTAGQRQESAEEWDLVVSGGHQQVYGTYIHGIFDAGETAAELIQALAGQKGISLETAGIEAVMDERCFQEKQYDKLADTLRKHLDMEKIYGMLREARMD